MVDSQQCPFTGQQHRTASKLLLKLLIVATAWWGSSSVGMGQPADAPGRVEDASDVLSLGTAATGTIAEVLVTVGDRVKVGQHLVQGNRVKSCEGVRDKGLKFWIVVMIRGKNVVGPTKGSAARSAVADALSSCHFEFGTMDGTRWASICANR